jgi:hypothetical protein
MQNKLRPAKRGNKTTANSQGGRGSGPDPIMVLMDRETSRIIDTVLLDETAYSSLKSATASAGLTLGKFVELAVLQKLNFTTGSPFGEKAISDFHSSLLDLEAFEAKLETVSAMIVSRCNELANHGDASSQLKQTAWGLQQIFDEMTHHLWCLRDEMWSHWNAAFRPALTGLIQNKEAK